MNKVKHVTIFANGTIIAFDDEGQQIPELQQPWLNFKALQKLAKAIARDDPRIEGKLPLNYDPLGDYVKHFKKRQARDN